MERCTSHVCTPVRKIWAPNQVLNLDEIKVGTVYKEHHGPKNPNHIRYMISSSAPYETERYGIWAKFRIMDPLYKGKEKARSLEDLEVAPYHGDKGLIWNPINWLERVSYDEIQGLQQIPIDVRKNALLFELGIKGSTLFDKKRDAKELFIDELLTDALMKEDDLSSPWGKALVSRLSERFGASSES